MPTEQYGSTLRAVGWFLDMEQAQGATIQEEGPGFHVRWHGPDGMESTRTLQPQELQAFHRLARSMRSDPAQAVRGTYTELLRTLGQELDRQRLSQVLIREERLLQVSGQVDGVFTTLAYGRDELRMLSERRQALRNPPAPKRHWWSF
jgi:hypothetical protein